MAVTQIVVLFFSQMHIEWSKGDTMNESDMRFDLSFTYKGRNDANYGIRPMIAF